MKDSIGLKYRLISVRVNLRKILGRLWKTDSGARRLSGECEIGSSLPTRSPWVSLLADF